MTDSTNLNNLEELYEFIEFIWGVSDGTEYLHRLCTFRYTDSKRKTIVHDIPIIHNHFDKSEISKKLTKFKQQNEDGKLCAFFSPSSFDELESRKSALESKSDYTFNDECVIKTNCFFVDIDNYKIQRHVWDRIINIMRPHYLFKRNVDENGKIVSKVHIYWKTDMDISLTTYTKTMRRLAELFGADTSVTNPSRLMRLPLYRHYKHKMVEGQEVIVSNEGYHITHKGTDHRIYNRHSDFIDLIKECEIIVKADKYDQQFCFKYLKGKTKLEGEGERNPPIYNFLCYLIDHEDIKKEKLLFDIIQPINERYCNPPLTDEVLRTTIGNAKLYHKTSKKQEPSSKNKSIFEIMYANELSNVEDSVEKQNLIEEKKEIWREYFADWVAVSYPKGVVYLPTNDFRKDEEFSAYVYSTAFGGLLLQAKITHVVNTFRALRILETAEHLIFRPHNDDKTPRHRLFSHNSLIALNMYRPPTINKEAEDIEALGLFRKYINTLFKKPSHGQFIEDWLSFTFQHPDKKIRYMVHLYSKTEGTGKSTFLEFLDRVYDGTELVSRIKQQYVSDGKWDDAYVYKKIIGFEEIDNPKDKNIIENIKELITNNKMQSNRKNKDSTQVENYANCISFSNSLAAFNLTDKSRRILPFHVTEDPMSDDFASELYEMLGDSYKISAIYNYYYNRTITETFKYLVKPFKTDLEKEMITISRTSSDNIFEYWYQEKKNWFACDVVCPQRWGVTNEELDVSMNNLKYITSKTALKYLQTNHNIPSGIRVPVKQEGNEKRITLWVIRNFEAYRDGGVWNHSKIAKAYLESNKYTDNFSIANEVRYVNKELSNSVISNDNISDDDLPY